MFLTKITYFAYLFLKSGVTLPERKRKEDNQEDDSDVHKDLHTITKLFNHIECPEVNCLCTVEGRNLVVGDVPSLEVGLPDIGIRGEACHRITSGEVVDALVEMGS